MDLGGKFLGAFILPARDMKVCFQAGRLVSRLSQYSWRVRSSGGQWGEILPSVVGEDGEEHQGKESSSRVSLEE